MHMDYCLDKARRLTHNNEYRLVYKHGKYEVGRMCVLYRMPVAKQSTRIGFVTGKKVGCAVERNRARRLMKEVLSPQSTFHSRRISYRNCWTWPSEKRYLRKSGKGNFVSLAKKQIVDTK